jgi:CDP-diacylglycerol--serine O-phosphatidyltransferase
MTWRKILPNLVTTGAMLAAFFSIVHSAHGEYALAAKLIMLCLILDGLDGNIARWIGGETQFGAELDTFVDITAYGLAPAMLIHESVAKHFGTWGLLLVGWTVLAGALRLSRFRVADPNRGNKGFTGLPITANATWVAMFTFIVQSDLIEDPRVSLTSGPMAVLVWSFSAIMLFLQISNVRYGKPSKTPVLFIGGIVMVALLFLRQDAAIASALAMCAYVFFYAFVTPFLPKHHVAIVGDDDTEDLEDEEDVTFDHS